MEFLYLLEKIRVPILNEFMLFITTFGEETAFLVLALIIFWCVDKRKGYYILSVGFFGILANQFLKLLFRIPRPWVLDQNFTILEQAREAASGYSFPSGHTQTAVGAFGGVAYTTKNKWVRYAGIAVAVLVPLSRMYLGVHTPWDVLASIVLAIALIVVMRPLILQKTESRFPVMAAIMLVLCIAFMGFVELYPFPADIDAHNLESGVKNAYTLLGSVLGILVVYFADTKWYDFKTNAVWWAQILKVAGGLGVVLAVKSGLKTPLNLLLGEALGRSVRYFMIVVVAGIVWPMTFKWFSKLGEKKGSV